MIRFARLLVLLPLLWVEGVWAEDCPSSLNLTTQAQIDSLPTLYENCQSFVRIDVSGDDIVDLDGLFIVEQVSYLGIFSSSLSDISGLHNLKFVWQWLELIASNLKSLEGLQNARFFGALKVEAPIETSPSLNANGAYFIELDGTRLANLDALAGVTNMQSSGIVMFGSPGMHIYNNLTLSDCSAVAPLLGWPNMPYSSETDLIDDSIYVGRANFVSNGVGANSPDDCLNAYSAKDNDGDGVQNISDNCISVANTDQNDNDGDGAGDACDTDDDNDGILDDRDLYPLIPIGDLLDTDADGAPDECDSACQLLGMQADDDDDGDGVEDSLDCNPLDSMQSQDTDGDQICNVYDSDDDNDGVDDEFDAFPLDPNEQVDTDGDGIGNNADVDDDNDGLSDIVEAELGTDSLKRDTDGDGWSDKEEVDEGTDPLLASSQPELSSGLPIWLLYQATQ